MLRKADYRGSIRDLSEQQLMDLRAEARRRGLRGVEAAVMREELRRCIGHPVSRANLFTPQPVDYAPPPRYNFDGYAGCRS